MTSKTVSIPELGMIAGTRMVLGAGVGLLLADRLDPQHRRAVGWALLAAGAASTIPLAIRVWHHDSEHGGRNGAESLPEDVISTGSTL
jgi:hypothetical protein